MRLYIKTTPNTCIVPYDYQVSLVGAIHKWIGLNQIHDELSLYSLSWLYNGKGGDNGLDFRHGADFFFSAHDPDLIQDVLAGIAISPEINYGLRVCKMQPVETPRFKDAEKFMLRSPVLVKRHIGNETKFYFPGDIESDECLTQTMMNKLSKAGISQDIEVRFDKDYPNPKTKLSNYKGIENKATFCPVILKGDEKSIAFAWDVGVGNCTGIGFGSLK